MTSETYNDLARAIISGNGAALRNQIANILYSEDYETFLDLIENKNNYLLEEEQLHATKIFIAAAKQNGQLYEILDYSDYAAVRIAIASEENYLANALINATEEVGQINEMIEDGHYEILQHVVANGHDEFANWLLDTFKNEAQEMITSNESVAFCEAVQQNNCALVKQMLQCCDQLHKAQLVSDSFHDEGFFEATFANPNNQELTEALLKAAIECDQHTHMIRFDHSKALRVAVKSGNTKIVERIMNIARQDSHVLEAITDYSPSNTLQDNHSAFRAAIHSGHKPIIDSMMGHASQATTEQDFRVLCEAVASENLQVVHKLLNSVEPKRLSDMVSAHNHDAILQAANSHNSALNEYFLACFESPKAIKQEQSEHLDSQEKDRVENLQALYDAVNDRIVEYIDQKSEEYGETLTKDDLEEMEEFANSEARETIAYALCNQQKFDDVRRAARMESLSGLDGNQLADATRYLVPEYSHFCDKRPNSMSQEERDILNITLEALDEFGFSHAAIIEEELSLQPHRRNISHFKASAAQDQKANVAWF